MKFYMTPGSCSTGIHILLEEIDKPFEVYLVNLLDTSLDVEDVTRRGCVHHALLDINLVCVLALIVNVCHSIRTARIPC